MNVVLDTNVLISAIYFAGVPGKILDAWQTGTIQLVISASILNEYLEVSKRLVSRYPDIEFQAILGLIAEHAVLVPDSKLSKSVSEDPDDDKFLACALSSGTEIIVSGDTDLLMVSGYQGIRVL